MNLIDVGEKLPRRTSESNWRESVTMPDLDEIRGVVESVLPSCFKVISVDLEYGDGGIGAPEEFDVAVRTQRISDDPEPHGWVNDLSTRIRLRWSPNEFRFTVHEHEEDGPSP